MAIQQINPGTAPIVWSTVDEAFYIINQNFTELVATIGTFGVNPVDFSSLSTNVSPSVTEFYDLGSLTNRWKDLYLSGSSLHLGNAILTANGTGIDLPAGSTIGGNLVDSEYFREIAVAGQSNIIAEAGGSDILTVASGNSGITITTNSATDTLTITNTGIVDIVAGTGITTSGTTTRTVSNDGVIDISTSPGSGISITGTKTNYSIANTGVLAVTTFGGSGITINNPSPGTYEIVNASPNINQNVFFGVAVPTQATVFADSATDTLTLAYGSGINITTDPTTDTITIANTGVTNIAASGSGINVSASTGSVNISNTGVTSLIAGAGISISSATGDITVTNTRLGFLNFAVSGNPNSIQADNATDTFTFVAGEGVVLIPNPTNDSLEVNVAYLVGNVYSDSSSLLVDAAGSQIVGNINTSSLRTSETAIALGSSAGAVGQGANGIAIGALAAQTNQGIQSIAIGPSSGNTGQGLQSVAVGNLAGSLNQGQRAVAIGSLAGSNSQGDYAVALGNFAGGTNQPANSIVINASGVALNGSAAGFFVDPIREVTGPQVLYYDPTGTKEITWGPVPAGGGGGGGGGVDFDLSVAADDSTQHKINSGETIKFIGANGITTTANGEGYITITGPSSISGNAGSATVANTLDITNTNGLTTVYYPTFVENRTSGQTVRADVDLSYRTDTNTLTVPNISSTQVTSTTVLVSNLDTTDSSAITVIPAMTFNSDITVQNELTVDNDAFVSGTLNVNDLVITGTITSQGSGTPEVFSDNEILLTAGTRVTISSSPMKMASFTTAERDALAAVNGDMIYNRTTNKFQGYANGVWVDLH